MLQTYIDQTLFIILYGKEVLKCRGERLVLFLNSLVKDYGCSQPSSLQFHLFFPMKQPNF